MVDDDVKEVAKTNDAFQDFPTLDNDPHTTIKQYVQIRSQVRNQRQNVESSKFLVTKKGWWGVLLLFIMDLRSLGFLSWNQTEISGGGSTYSAVGSFFMVNQEDF